MLVRDSVYSTICLRNNAMTRTPTPITVTLNLNLGKILKVPRGVGEEEEDVLEERRKMFCVYV